MLRTVGAFHTTLLLILSPTINQRQPSACVWSVCVYVFVCGNLVRLCVFMRAYVCARAPARAFD